MIQQKQLTLLSVEYRVMNGFISWLNDELNTRGWSQNELGRRAKITGAAVSLVASGKQAPTWDFCKAIAKPLGKRPEELFRLAGLLPQRRGDDEVTFQDFVELGLELTHEERTRVMEYILSQVRAPRRKRDGESDEAAANPST